MASVENWIYWLAFGIYSLAVCSVGLWIYRREKQQGKIADNQAFWSANRSLSAGGVGLSISASMMSISWSCVYGVQLFYWYGVGGIWLLSLPWLVTMAGFYWLAPRFRGMQIYSQPELLAKRFGSATRQMLAPVLLFVFTVWAGAEIYAAGITIAPFLGISVPLTLLLIALVVAFYSYTGGFSAVVSTDKIQFALVALFIIVIAGAGIDAVHQHLPLVDFFRKLPRPPKVAEQGSDLFAPGIALILITFFAYLPGWLIETDVWVRIQAAGSNHRARRGVLIALLNSAIFVGLLPLVIGLAALHLYPPVGSAIPARLQDGTLIFSTIMQDHVPLWLNAVLGVGLIAAAMSTVDTCGNIVALSFSYDLAEPRLQSRWSPERLNRLARWSSVGAILLAFVYALFTESLWDIFYLSSGILTTTVFLPVIGAFRGKTTALQARSSIAAGFTATLLFYFMESRGWLKILEPAWLAETGLGYILFGFLFSSLAFWFSGCKRESRTS